MTIPKLYNGKNKTFSLFGYEGIRDSRPRHDDTTNTVPTPAMDNRDFSALLAKGGAQYAIYDRATRVAAAGGWRSLSVNSFPGQPTSRHPFRQSGRRYYRLLSRHREDPG